MGSELEPFNMVDFPHVSKIPHTHTQLVRRIARADKLYQQAHCFIFKYMCIELLSFNIPLKDPSLYMQFETI